MFLLDLLTRGLLFFQSFTAVVLAILNFFLISNRPHLQLNPVSLGFAYYYILNLESPSISNKMRLLVAHIYIDL